MERKGYRPPYTLTDKTVTLIAKITEIVTRRSITTGNTPNPRLRKENRVKTIQASLAIENNTLSVEQVTDILKSVGDGSFCFCDSQLNLSMT